MLKILNIPNKTLTTPSKPIKNADVKLKKLIQQMEQTLMAQDDPPGVGLAAPQIGENIQLFIIKPSEKAKTELFINPRVIKKSSGRALYQNRSKAARTRGRNSSLEGCLSVPRIWSPVSRSKKILVEYKTLSGEKKREWLSEFKAVIVQHEIDHLKGILFTQRATEQGAPLYEEKGDKLERMKL